MKMTLIEKIINELQSLKTPRGHLPYHDVQLTRGTLICYMETDADILDEKTQRRIGEALAREMKKSLLIKHEVRIEIKLWPRLTNADSR